jgi:FlaG/FlaF family flagellin (archaellin)
LPDVKKLIKNSSAVSDVLGEMLMTTIAVILLSSIAVSIFSYGGPADVPHIQVKEWMDTQTDTIYMEHSGGEFIDTDSLEILVNINNNRHTYSSSQIYTNLGNRSIWELGDTIEIDTWGEWGVDIKEGDEISVYLIDTPSKEIIQNLKLSSEDDVDSNWITPQGSAVDTSQGGSAGLFDVYQKSDGFNTTYHPPATADFNKYEEFDFGLNAALWGAWPIDNITSVTLRLVYSGNNNSCEKIKLKVWNESSGNWYEESLPEHDYFRAYSTDLSAYITNTTELANLKVRLVATGNAGVSTENLHVDYMALYVN